MAPPKRGPWGYWREPKPEVREAVVMSWARSLMECFPGMSEAEAQSLIEPNVAPDGEMHRPPGTASDLVERNLRIFAMRRLGLSLGEIGAQFGLSREGVRRVCAATPIEVARKHRHARMIQAAREYRRAPAHVWTPEAQWREFRQEEAQ